MYSCHESLLLHQLSWKVWLVDRRILHDLSWGYDANSPRFIVGIRWVGINVSEMLFGVSSLISLSYRRVGADHILTHRKPLGEGPFMYSCHESVLLHQLSWKVWLVDRRILHDLSWGYDANSPRFIVGIRWVGINVSEMLFGVSSLISLSYRRVGADHILTHRKPLVLVYSEQKSIYISYIGEEWWPLLTRVACGLNGKMTES